MSTTTQTPKPEMIPQFLLVSVIALVVLSLGLVGYASFTDRAPTGVPAVSAVAQERSIVVQINERGGAVVFDPTSGAEILTIAPNRAGFVTGVWRALSYKRSLKDADPATPVFLQKRENNRLYLVDPATGWDFQIHGFGADNIAAFGQLLTEQN